MIGGIAARRVGYPLIVIRTDHKREFLKPNLGNRILISRFTDGMITFSERARKAEAEHFRLPLERVKRVSPALDLNRYDSQQEWKDMKTVFGIGPEDVVIGMVARFPKVSKDRSLLGGDQERGEGVSEVKTSFGGEVEPDRGERYPADQKTWIEPWVVLAGYRTEDYIDTLACMEYLRFHDARVRWHSQGFARSHGYGKAGHRC